uniref:Protein-glutamine gamma-glutamyltransferase n=1 Tax=virus sp. ctr1v16 TaxID=2825823 RepID=A0A8S5RQ92_9VIRU|nr:MAG TPA: Protein-glutamine gamma-glutamyltransferase [virus sp. ctr1v16]
MRKRKFATFVITLMIVMTGVSTIKVISYAQEESENSSVSIQTGDMEYRYSAESDPQNGVALKVEWNEPKLGEDTTFHVSADGGSGRYLFRMDAPSYSEPGEYSFESVADPSRGAWIQYTDECESHDFEFTMTASGVYNFRFYVMDKTSGVYYMRVSTNIQVSDRAYPSVGDIVNAAVKKCSKETDGSDYEKALWLHDWLLQQLDYDHSLKWSSAESALTRKLGTCQAYESAYSKLLTAAGIENAETRDTYDGHTWNAMKLDGKWYQVDCTWDDTKDNYYNFDQTHLYFGLTDELMALAHNGHNKIYTASGYGTRSTSLADNYFVRNGDAAKWARAYAERIQKNLNAGKTKFEVSTDNASYPPSISGIQNGIIAYALNQMTWKAGSKKVALRVAGTSTKLSFTAKYTDTVKRVRIVFAPNGGRVSSGSKTVICGKTYGTLPTPTRRGYTFAGWYTAKSGGSKIGSSSVVRTTKNQTLYARWKLVKYKIQYSLGKGTNSRSNPVGYTVASRTIVLKNPVRKGYTFKGWYSDPKYKKKVTKIAAGSTGSRKLYARWVRK